MASRHMLPLNLAKFAGMTRVIPRVVALLATYNEERFVAGCLEHLLQQHVDVYLINNCSSDQTVTAIWVVV
jgi:hypothetical protein